MKIIFILALFYCCRLEAQTDSTAAANTPVYRHEILVITENDNFTLQFRDGYYTNGLFINWNMALALNDRHLQRHPKVQKVVQGVQIGQRIYNPVSFDRKTVAVQDRPFAGYLFACYDRRICYRNGAMLQWSAALGTIGPNSFGGNVQTWYHGAINIYPVEGWPTQLRNETSLNAGFLYTNSLFAAPIANRIADISWLAAANLGNAYTNAGAGLLLRAGRLEGNHQTVHWNNRVDLSGAAAPHHKSESYFFVQPMLTAQAYNAPLQGGLFIKNKGPYTSAINPLVFTISTGIRYAENRWTLSLFHVHRSREAKKQQRAENYGSVQVGYKFGRQ